jgi:hypothetical protein
MALVADDMSFVGGLVCTPAKPCTGRDTARRDVVQQFIDYHARLTIVGTPQIAGSRVTARTEASDDRSRSAGVDRFVQNLTVEVRDGKIASWVNTPDLSDPQTARFVASQRAQAQPPPTQLPRTGEGGPLGSPLTVAVVGGTLLALGLTVRRSANRS